MNIRLFYFLLFFLSISYNSFAQRNIKDSSVFISMFSANYSYQIPGEDLADRFGNNSNIGASFMMKTKSNWILSVDYSYMFGEKIHDKDSILKSIATSTGDIIDGNGQYADIVMYERGFHSTIKAGKIFPVFGTNPNSGIFIMAGAGLLQHKIRIENSENAAPQIKDDYKKGYDKLSNGFALSEMIGYTYFGNKRMANFYIGIEFVQAWTQSRRDYDFTLMGKDETKHFDVLSGIKVGWIIPLYKRLPNKFYYF